MLKRLAPYMEHPDRADAALKLGEFYQELQSAGLRIDPSKCSQLQFDRIGVYAVIAMSDPDLYLVIETREAYCTFRRELSLRSHTGESKGEIQVGIVFENSACTLCMKHSGSHSRLASAISVLGMPGDSADTKPIGYEELRKLLRVLSSL